MFKLGSKVEILSKGFGIHQTGDIGTIVTTDNGDGTVFVEARGECRWYRLHKLHPLKRLPSPEDNKVQDIYVLLTEGIIVDTFVSKESADQIAKIYTSNGLDSYVEEHRLIKI